MGQPNACLWFPTRSCLYTAILVPYASNADLTIIFNTGHRSYFYSPRGHYPGRHQPANRFERYHRTHSWLRPTGKTDCDDDVQDVGLFNSGACCAILQ